LDPHPRIVMSTSPWSFIRLFEAWQIHSHLRIRFLTNVFLSCSLRAAASVKGVLGLSRGFLGRSKVRNAPLRAHRRSSDSRANDEQLSSHLIDALPLAGVESVETNVEEKTVIVRAAQSVSPQTMLEKLETVRC
jgi:hypothetical protein